MGKAKRVCLGKFGKVIDVVYLSKYADLLGKDK